MPKLGCRAWVLIGCLTACLAHGFGSATRTFSYDDIEAIVENPVVRGDLPWSSVFDRDYWQHRGAVGHYRPTATASLRADYALWGPDARGFRWTNLGLHAGVVALLVALSWRSAPGRIPLGALLVAAHPALADSVAWISGRTSLVSALPLVAATWFLVQQRGSLTLAMGVAFSATLLGVGGKEDAVLLLPLVVLAARDRALPVGLAAAAGLALLLLARFQVYGQVLPEAAGAPYADLSVLERLAFGGRALGEAARTLFWPFSIAPSYRGAPCFQPGTPPGGAWALVALAVLAAPGALLLHRRDTFHLVLGTAALALFPMTQLVPLGEPFAPRYLYLPLVVLAPLVALRPTRLRLLASTVLVLGCCVLSSVTGRAYATRAAHAKAVLAVVPNDPLAWTSLGVAHAEADDPQAAREAFERALAADAQHARAWSNLAALELEAGEFERGIATLERSLELFPGNGIAWTNLGAAHLRAGDPAGALEAYERALAALPGLSAAWRGRGAALEALERPDEALESLARALALDPGDELAARRRNRIQARLSADQVPPFR
ncbi:MAG: tetratricopeptide repeat protein [Planctomycetota bacterium]